MARALELARRGWGRTAPNPMVGCVLVRDDQVVGEGWHAEYGGDHAEVAALSAAGDEAAGSTAYVTLEPCGHHGKTPPCADALVRAGVERVVYAAADPTADAGGGSERLREAGVDTVGGVLRREARRLDAAFFHAAEAGETWAALKLAVSLDGKIARSSGEGSRVTGAEAVAEAHRLRAGFDAVAVGAGTARVDDPRLDPRGDVEPRVPPTRIVLDPSLTVEPGAALLGEGEGPVLLFADPDAPGARARELEEAGARVVRVPASARGIDVGAALEACWEEGLRSILFEGGGSLARSLLLEDRIHRIYLFHAPRVFGPGGVPAFPGSWPEDALEGWTTAEVRRLGDDALQVLEPDEA